ncbi:MAG TPA: fibronectin type III-like domain-contianing protein, partial [Anaerolineaceae bacterium]|nr:fibronectin type III-like domain-contianing protein [Anaerolineaceae bacterium]
GSPVSMPWIDQVAGVVQLWYAGQEAGTALADVLFGDVAPSGKLPLTFPKRFQDNPAFINYPGENGQVLYGEGLYVGYRYYDHKDVQPLFPFGFGLSYTTFEYANLRIDPVETLAGQPVQIRLDVTNTGARKGQEVVQLYVHDVEARLPRPDKELKAFAKIALEPGETQTVQFTLDQDAFWYYDPQNEGWGVDPGVFEILVGASSRDIHLVGQVHLLPEHSNGNGGLHTALPLRAVMENPQGKSVLTRHFPNLINLPEVQTVLDFSLNDIANLMPQEISPRKLAEVNADLARIPSNGSNAEKQ